MMILLSVVSISCTKSLELDFTGPSKKAQEMVVDFMDSKSIPGMSIAVAYRGTPIWSQGFGQANIEFNVPVEPHSKFRIASVSKPIAAVLTAYLYQNAVIDIDAPLLADLPDFTDRRYDFTLRQLMSHAAGIRHYWAKDTLTAHLYHSISAGMAIINEDKLLHKPGSRWHYTSYGYNIVGHILEIKTGKTFEALLQDSLFTPLQMQNSTIDHPYRIIDNRCAAYVLNEDGHVKNAPFYDNRYKIPSGAILSTAEDMVQFGQAIINTPYLNESTKEFIFTPFQYTDEEDSDTAFGWINMLDEAGRRVYGHLGGQTGSCSAIMIYPEYDLVIAWLGNRNADWSDKPVRSIADLFLEVIK
ncbi:beta-lactamase family protein [bacterium]|nr:beta-lactamase family protein [bacterium]